MDQNKADDDGLRSVMTFEDRTEADMFINDLPAVLKELKLDYRFVTLWTPRKIVERQQRGYDRKVTSTFYEVCMRDKFPEAAPPALTAADISEAWYRVKKKKSLPSLERTERAESESESEMTAFGRTQHIKDWAKVFHTKPELIRKHLILCGDLESALSQIALRKFS